MNMSNGCRRNEAILHVLCILDGFINVLEKSLVVLDFLVNIHPFNGRIGLSMVLVRDWTECWDGRLSCGFILRLLGKILS